MIRRQFLAATFCQAFFTTIFSVLPKSTTASADLDYADEILQSAIQNVEPALNIGRQYLHKRSSAMGEAEKLFRDLARELGTREQNIRVDKTAFKKWVKAQIDRDLRSGNVTRIDGWVVSRTEAIYSASLARRNSNIVKNVF